jgi:hypothetical protein
MEARTAAGQAIGERAPRTIRVTVRADWAARDARGLLSSDARARSLRKVLVTYPDVRHVLPDRVSLEATVDPRTLATVARFLERQHWLLTSVAIE